MAVENPYSSPEASSQLPANTHYWQGRKFTVSASNQTKHLWLLGTVLVAIDDGMPITSSQIRWKEDFTFDFEHEGQSVEGRVTQLNNPVQRLEYRLTIAGVKIAHAKAPVENWLIALFVGVFIGIAGSLILLAAISYTLFVFRQS